MAAVLALIGGCGDEPPSRADLVRTGVAMMEANPGAVSDDLCDGALLLAGGNRQDLAEMVKSFLSTEEMTGGSEEKLSDGERQALKDNGVSFDEWTRAFADDEGQVTDDGALLMADIIINACADR